MPRSRINGITVHYQQAGRGPDLVLIHGLFANLAFWYLSILPILARQFRVTVYDLRGHGLSDMPASGYTTRHLARDLAALLQHLRIERAHLVGHSYGGAVALQYAAVEPDRVASLTLADARVPALQPTFPPRSARRWKQIRERLRRSGMAVEEDVPRIAYSFFEDLARLQHDPRHPVTRQSALLLRQWNRGSRSAQQWLRLVHTTTAAKELASRSDLPRQKIRQIPQPVLAVFGEHSSCLRTLRGLEQSLPQIRKVILPGVGHFHPILQPDEFTQTLTRFVHDLPGSS